MLMFQGPPHCDQVPHPATSATPPRPETVPVTPPTPYRGVCSPGALIGRRVRKVVTHKRADGATPDPHLIRPQMFHSQFYTGRVVEHNKTTGYYLVTYEDSDEEEYDLDELQALLF